MCVFSQLILCFLFFLPSNSFPFRFTTCDYTSKQTCQAAFNNRGAPLTAILIKVVGNVLSGVRSAEKASLVSQSEMFQAPPVIIPLSLTHPPPFQRKTIVGDTSPVGAAADSLSGASRSLGLEISTSFFICPAGAVTTRETVLAAVGKIIHSAVKNNNLYLYRRLVSKRNYASITGHFRPLVICLRFHKNVYFSLRETRPVSTVIKAHNFSPRNQQLDFGVEFQLANWLCRCLCFSFPFPKCLCLSWAGLPGC